MLAPQPDPISFPSIPGVGWGKRPSGRESLHFPPSPGEPTAVSGLSRCAILRSLAQPLTVQPGAWRPLAERSSVQADSSSCISRVGVPRAGMKNPQGGL